ncbi:MAG TPA: hypothetical protein VKP78_06755 [bacterium]|nr:hypothetical protein [bacterium]
MRQRKISFTAVVFFILFVLGILFASKYSPGKSKLATICFSENNVDSDKVTQALADVTGIRTVFLDPKSELLTFRYNSSDLTLQKIKDQLRKMGIEAQSLQSVRLIKSSDQKEQSRQKLFTLDIYPSSELEN